MRGQKPWLKIENEIELQIGRVLGVEIKLNYKFLTIINIYGPNKDDITTFKFLEQELLEHDEKTYIIGGDFNTVLNSNLDKKNGNANYHNKCRELIHEIISTNNLIDMCRIKHPEKSNIRGTPIRLRLYTVVQTIF